jgi:hypothetical protein
MWVHEQMLPWYWYKFSAPFFYEYIVPIQRIWRELNITNDVTTTNRVKNALFSHLVKILPITWFNRLASQSTQRRQTCQRTWGTQGSSQIFWFHRWPLPEFHGIHFKELLWPHSLWLKLISVVDILFRHFSLQLKQLPT